MKKIKTKPFGEIEVDEQQIIDFPEGIPGFDYIKKFILLDSGEEKSPFKWLQAYEESGLAFVVINPESFMKKYDPELSPIDLEAVEASSEDELLILSIVTIPEDPSKMTANLQGPVVINPVKKLGRQAISMSDKYSVRHLILEELRSTGRGG